MRRIGRAGLVTLAVVLGLGAAVGYRVADRMERERRARDAHPMVSGQLRVEGPLARVEIRRDARGIPHVLAESEADAWLGLGFAHAQDRLGQMLWLRALARGRTSEHVGEVGLGADRLARTIGFARLGEAQLERTDPVVLAVLEAYARGVNARIARIRAGRVSPPEGVRIGPLPPAAGAASALEPADDVPESPSPSPNGWLSRVAAGAAPLPETPDWRPVDSLAVAKLVSWAAGASHARSAVLSDLIRRLDSGPARPFFPGGEREVDAALLRVPDIARELAETDPNAAAPFAVAGFRGSAWALPGRFTSSGSPILVAELSASPTAPSLLYEAHVRGGGLDTAGVTIPGLPVFWTGRNPDVAWAALPAAVVVVDLFVETLRGSQPAQYQNGSRWVPLSERSEVIRVAEGRGRFREETLRVRETRHGPLVDPLLPPGPTQREPLALSWTGARAGDSITGLLRVAHARSAAEVVAALAAHHDPPVEVVYADRAGEVGVKLAGWLPRRALPSGLVPVPGRLRGFDWRTGLEPAAMPGVRVLPDPPPDAVSTVSAVDLGLREADDWMVASGELADLGFRGTPIEWLWRAPERALRVRELVADLASAGPVELRAAAAVQGDLAANRDPELVGALLSIAGSGPELGPEAREVAQLLRSWDGESDVESPGAAAFEILVGHLAHELFGAALGPELLDRYLALQGVRPRALVETVVIAAARGGRAGSWTDPDKVGDAARRSLRRTWMSLTYRLGHNRERWRWGRLHTVAFRAFRAPPGDLEPAAPGLGPFALGGGEAAVQRAAHDLATFEISAVSTYRMAVDLAAPDRMLTMLAPGQSEHRGHAHFDDGVSEWLDGDPTLVLTSPFQLEEAAVARLVLESLQ